MEPVGPANVPVETHLLLSCYREADQADIVAMGLDQLRAALSESFHGYLIALAGEIRDSSRLLRSLVDCAHVYITRVPFMTNYLSILLPCLSRTLKDIVMYYEEKTLSREIRWRKMYNKMTEEAGGLPLPQRFVLFNHFLSLLKQLLTRYVIQASVRCPGSSSPPSAIQGTNLAHLPGLQILTSIHWKC